MEFKSTKMVKLVRLALLLVCLAVIIPHAMGRPSNERHSQLRLVEQLLRRKEPEAAGETRHNLGHHLRRRSTDFDYDKDYKRVQQCYEDEEVNELCQRCSKVTKSSLVFPMCCSNEDETMTWCKAYVYYGIQT